jgi:hypothetical protein
LKNISMNQKYPQSASNSKPTELDEPSLSFVSVPVLHHTLILAAAAAQADVVADGAPAMTRWRMEQQDTTRRRMGQKLVPHIFPVDGAPNRRRISGHRLEKRHFSTSIPVKKHTKTNPRPAPGYLLQRGKRGCRTGGKRAAEYVKKVRTNMC